MRGILMTVCLAATCVRSEVTVQPDFQDDKILGTWYSIGLASDSNWFKAKKNIMEMCTTLIRPDPNGNLELVSTYPKGDRCERKTMNYIKTDHSGRFHYKSPRYGSDYDIRVVETNYDEFALIHSVKSKASDVSNVVFLYGRTKYLRPELIEKFQRFAKAQGLTSDQILILPHSEKCMT
ncbi:hypothetical protein GDO86_014772 [Hymenochirus boettgeri]|uniref:Lipocalin/cytosolic fatty-acid binding domain-containing protein n=1 Tax=Hymenochirus boettgeri TaxID=247094 RepID=A0A8T2JVW6_9PIPI|nr:hypothetical protein GDO86_014772 [Hymenochirus boettgeri]